LLVSEVLLEVLDSVFEVTRAVGDSGGEEIGEDILKNVKVVSDM